MLKTALGCREKSKLCPLSLVCACHQDSISKCSELKARSSPLLTHFCTAGPRIRAHCVLPLPWELTSRELREMRRNLCLPERNASLLRKVVPCIYINIQRQNQTLSAFSNNKKVNATPGYTDLAPLIAQVRSPVCFCNTVSVRSWHSPPVSCLQVSFLVSSPFIP